MEVFIDTADISAIKKSIDMGFCDGVTTNPSLIAKSGQDFQKVIGEISAIVNGPVSAEVVSTDFESMIQEAQVLSKISKHVVIKLPLNAPGLKACQVLSRKGIKTNVTLCFQAGQALLAAKSGATYVSLFLGRLVDCGHDPLKILKEIKDIYNNYKFKTKILTASIRDPRQIIESALFGADACTFPPNFLEKMIHHPLTDKGLEIFEADWAQRNQKNEKTIK